MFPQLGARQRASCVAARQVSPRKGHEMKPLLQIVAAVGLSCLSSAHPVPVVISPASVWLKTGQTQKFVVTTPGYRTFVWSVDKGKISATGLYRAVAGADTVTVTATPPRCLRCKGTATVNVVTPPMTYTARTDQTVLQLPNPMPTWGGANGAGTTWVNPEFPAAVYTRLTDSATSLIAGATIQTADSGEPQLGSIDGLHFVVKGTGGHSYVIDTKTAAKTGIDSKYHSLQFSSRQPLVLVGLDQTAIRLIVAKPDWSGVASDRVVFDFASTGCLGVGFKSTWGGIFSISNDDTTFKTSFSNTGGQGTGNYVVTWSAAKGCSVYDTLQGVVNRRGVLLGTIDDGENPLADRFYLHEGGGGESARFSMLAGTIRKPDGTPGCVAGNCLVDRPYLWQVNTTHVRPCSYQCDGHSAKGATGFYSGKNQRFHMYKSLEQPLTPMANFPPGFPDQHGSAHNQATTEPVFLVSADTTPVSPYPVWGYDEVLGIPTDGSQIVYRMGQTLNTGTSQYFICQNSIMGISQDGHDAYFTSDMGGNGVLGYEADGVTPRCDVFKLTLPY